MEGLWVQSRMAIAVAAATLTLYGCGGGGGGTSQVRPTPPDSGYEDVDENGGTEDGGTEDGGTEDGGTEDGGTEDGGTEEIQAVKIAVLDNEFRLSHEEFDGRIAGVHNVVGEDDDMEAAEDADGNLAPEQHGTPVAALAAGNTFGVAPEAELELIRVTEGTSAWGSDIRSGLEHAAVSGALIANVSYGSAWLSMNREETVQSIQAANDGAGMAVVVAAGNSATNLSRSEDGNPPALDYDALEWTAQVWDQLIIAGSSDANGDLSTFSNYAGEDERIQDRFMVAQGEWLMSASYTEDDAVGFFFGTSMSAPRISGALALLHSRWPHLTSKESTGHLLKTADQGSELYEQNDCGPDENLNCGFYYLGQGHLDIEAALEPDGDLAIASQEETVNTASYAPAESRAAWSSSFGGGLDPQALTGAVAFDALGRDYTLDLSGHSQQVQPYGQRLADRVERIASAGLNPRPITTDIMPGLSMTSRHTAGGGLGASEMRFDTGYLELSAFGFHQGETGLMDPWSPESGMAMLSDGSGGLAHLLDTGAGFGATLPLNDRWSMDVGHWAGSAGGEEDSLYRGYRQARTDVALRFAAASHLEMELGYGQRQEDGGVLGSRGFGALSLGDQTRMNLLNAGVNLSLGDHFGVMARYEQGYADVAGGPGMIRSIDGLTTEQSALGLTFEHDRHEAVFMVSQPLRVTGGEAQLDVPVGRDLDGSVIRERRSAGLAPGGRQQDVELGYAFAPSVDSRLNLNLLYSRHPDHQSGSDMAGVATYSARF
ncbi:S8 family serine peptidase [Thioalkalivibrio sp. ALMg11]|uniref:S8 family peptidase n=1 Tax=Thioalkalivibrio sp. ALMg11 TaxID=1158165 RepID=UPI001E5D5578|nr:S8 family serine peptidase [Thioalkalivibrio sp. ALMg11]